MRWLGPNPAILLVALALASSVLLVLHLHKPRARRVTVPSLALWRAVLPSSRDTHARRVSPRQWLSLLLALAIVGASLLALADPELVSRAEPRELVLVIDTSPSMRARDVAPNRLARAKQQAAQLVSALGPYDHAVIVALGERAIPITSRSGDRATLLRAIEELTPSATRGDLAAAATLALDLLRARGAGELVLFSDGALANDEGVTRLLASAPAVRARQQRVGSATRNLAITMLSTRDYPLDHAHAALLVRVESFGQDDEPLTLGVWSGDALLRRETLTLAGGSAVTRVLHDLPSSEGLLRATLTASRGPDVLPDDDVATLRLPARERTRVLAVSSDDRYLEAALLLDDRLLVDELAPAAYRDASGYDVVVFDGVLPASAPGIPALYLGALANKGVFPLLRGPVLQRPFFDRVTREHPLVRGLALSDVNIAQAGTLTLAAGDVVVAETSTHRPLLVEGTRDGQPFITLGFDLRDSDLPLRPAFPLLVMRAVARLAAIPEHIGSASTWPREESTLAPRQLWPAVGAAHPRSHDAQWLSRPWPWLLALALLLLMLEWLSLYRRWTR